jgi:archaellum biogenesis ATPase FlaH
MGYWSQKESNMQEKEKYQPKETVAEVEKYPFVEYPARGISKATCEKYGVRCGFDEKDGKTPRYFYFPSYNKKGKVVGYKRQDTYLPKEADFHWVTVGTVAISSKLFGQQVCEHINRKKQNLILTEGEWDCLSVYQSCVDSVKGTQYSGMEPFVASIPMGTSNAVESILHNEDFVKGFDSLTFFFDDDHCTPAEIKKKIVKGHEAREAVANALVGSKLSLFTVTPTMGHKDASDYLQNGKSKELAKVVQFDKRPYSAEKIVRASDISLEQLLEPRPEGIYVNCFPELMQKIHGFRTRELVLLTAPSGVGKSTVSSIFANAFIEQGERVGQIYLEETNKETLQRAVAAKLKVNYLKFKDKPLECGRTHQEIEAAYKEICENDKVIMLGHFGSLPISELIGKIKHMHFVEGCKYIILDHLSVVISGSDVVDERKELDIVMTELAAFCAANEVCIIAICHINRTAAPEFKAPKGKENEPFWVKITKEMMRGSAALEQLSFIILGLEPQILPNRNRGPVRLTVLKNRPWGYLGVADTFEVDDDTWEVISLAQQVEDF